MEELRIEDKERDALCASANELTDKYGEAVKSLNEYWAERHRLLGLGKSDFPPFDGVGKQLAAVRKLYAQTLVMLNALKEKGIIPECIAIERMLNRISGGISAIGLAEYAIPMLETQEQASDILTLMLAVRELMHASIFQQEAHDICTDVARLLIPLAGTESIQAQLTANDLSVAVLADNWEYMLKDNDAPLNVFHTYTRLSSATSYAYYPEFNYKLAKDVLETKDKWKTDDEKFNSALENIALVIVNKHEAISSLGKVKALEAEALDSAPRQQ